MNPKIRGLLERKQKATSKAKAIHNAAAAEDRDLTVAEQREFNELTLQLKQIGDDIDAEMRSIEADRTAIALPADRALVQPGSGDYPQYLDEHQAPTGRRFAQMFPGAQLSNGGFRDFGQFAAVLKSGMPDPRLQLAASTGGSESVGADGGAVVPTMLLAELMDDSLEDEIVRPRARIRPLESNSAIVAGFDTLNHGAGIGGFVASWAAEGTQFTFQKAKVRPMTLKVSKLGILAAATNELLADSSYYRMELPELITKAIGFSLDSAFLTGDGVGKPRGVLNDPALIVVAKESGQAADTIVWENIKKMFQRLHPASRKRAVWVVNNNATVQLLSLVQFIKNVAATENVGGTWIPVMREQDGRFFILGIEVIFTEKVPVLGDQGDIVLADFSQYFVGLRGTMTLSASQHVLFQSDETAFRGILRADGQGRWNAPSTPWTGSETLSPFVTLAARA